MAKKRRSYSYNEYIRSMKMVKKLGVAETSRRTGIPKDTVEGWKHGKVPPLARWVPISSNELAYIIGVLFGDGYIYINKHYYVIKLGVTDYEFTVMFSMAMSKTLNKRYMKPKWDKSNNVWVVTYLSKAFYTWYKGQTLKTLKQYIEYSRETVVSFLRGLYDSEGGHYIYKKKRYSRIHLCNNDSKLLKYTQCLLKKYFNIVATGPYLNKKAGTKNEMKDGRIAKTKHDNYLIVISRRQYTEKFLSMIGFSITEKQLGLPRRK